MTVYLVRHAKAGDREEWTASDHLRPLSRPGRRQAEGLVKLFVKLFEDRPPGRILSSPALRCVETVAPLARACGLEVEETEALAEGAGPWGALALLREKADRGLVLCSHGDVIQEVLEELVDRGIDLGRTPRLAKGSTWALEVDGDAVLGGRYVPPPD